ncbi:phospholipid/cholesterol/gamma-HCH transport system substrate-binding protein [Phyllobacterium sp. YR620]|uniref:MlaD family protein n=1 Tax=Phyllobacterium sp. YR620 TaxID=1881066 RepID=UPI000888B739|nr:MlaD family protein [Phyllobacterium sp. YR620]SDP58123.1 phospholipid/cholesterol/gamma-HCH transport system substrate-binding protein [Phyllobacterium sp. YR620]
METKANYFLVAIFLLAVSFLAFGFFYWIGRYGETRETATLEIRVPGSVTGLAANSPVYFNGLKVGQVRRLYIDSTNPDAVIVQTDVDATTPITRSTVATLAFELLAGRAYIELKGGKAYEPKLLEEAEKEDTVARVDIDPTSLKTLVQTAQDWIDRVDKATTATEKYIADTRGPFVEGINQAKAATDKLAASTDLINKYGERAKSLNEITHDARDVIARINEASVKIDNALAKVDRELSDEKGSAVSDARAKLEAYQQQAKTLDAQLASILKNIGSFTGTKLPEVQKFISASRRSVDSIDRAVSDFADDPKKLFFGEDSKVPEFEAPR